MVIKSVTLFSRLEKISRNEDLYLFNMVNEALDGRFLPIKCYDAKMKWMALLVWDNERELLHGPFLLKGGIAGSHEYIENYKWAGGELYIYFSGQVDYAVRGLENGKAVFEEA
jgi:hypothetical protein